MSRKTINGSFVNVAGVEALDELIRRYDGFSRAPTTIVMPEGRTLVQGDSDAGSKGSFLKRFTKGVLNSLPIYSSLKTNDKALEEALRAVDSKAMNGHVDGKDLWEIEYVCGVNNHATTKALMEKISEKNYAIDGAIESAHEIKNVGGILGGIQRGVNGFLGATGLDNYVGKLEIYKGDNKWDTLWRNTRMSGETQALVSTAAVAGLGSSMIYAISAGANGLHEATGSDSISNFYGIGLPLAFLGLSAYSGNILSGARSGAMLAQQYFGKKSKGDRSTRSGKAAGLLNLGLTASLLGLVGCTTAHAAEAHSGPSPPATPESDIIDDQEVPIYVESSQATPEHYVAPHSTATDEMKIHPVSHASPEYNLTPAPQTTPEVPTEVPIYQESPVATAESHLATGESHIATGESEIGTPEHNVPEYNAFEVRAHQYPNEHLWEALRRADAQGDNDGILDPSEYKLIGDPIKAIYSPLFNDQNRNLTVNDVDNYFAWLNQHQSDFHLPHAGHRAHTAQPEHTELSGLTGILVNPFVHAGSSFYNGLESGAKNIWHMLGFGDHATAAQPEATPPQTPAQPVQPAHEPGFFGGLYDSWFGGVESVLPATISGGGHGWLESITSPFSLEARAHPNEPLWTVLAAADTNHDGAVTGNEIDAYLSAHRGDAADISARYSHLADFANSDGKEGISIQDAEAFLKDYHDAYLHNFHMGQRKHVGGGDLIMGNDGKFHFNFNTNDGVHQGFYGARQTNFHPENSDVVVRVFRHGDGTPIAIADIGVNGANDGMMVRNGLTLSDQDILNGIHSGIYFAEASFFDGNQTHSNPECYNDDKVIIFDRIGGIGHGHIHAGRVHHKPEPWQVMCRPSGPDEPTLPEPDYKPQGIIDTTIPHHGVEGLVNYTTDRGWEALHGDHRVSEFGDQGIVVNSGDHIGVGPSDVAAEHGFDTRTRVLHSNEDPVYGRETVPSKIKNAFLPHNHEWERYRIARHQDGSHGQPVVLHGNQGLYDEGTSSGHPDEVRYHHRRYETVGGHSVAGHRHTLLGGVRVNDHRNDYLMVTDVSHRINEGQIEFDGSYTQRVHVDPMRNSTAYMAGVATGALGTYGVMSVVGGPTTTVIKAVPADTLGGGQAGGPGIVGGQ